jgi:hypothetical protein
MAYWPGCFWACGTAHHEGVLGRAKPLPHGQGVKERARGRRKGSGPTIQFKGTFSRI